jgi:TolB-like protein
MSEHGFWSRVRQARLGRLLLVYAGASWATLEATDFFINRFGLPPWFLSAALVFLVAGLCILTATALVQARPAGQDPEGPTAWDIDLADFKEAVSQGRLPRLTWARAIVGGALVFGLLSTGAGLHMLFSGSGDEASAPPAAEDADRSPNSIAVLPFVNLSADPANEYFSDGLAEELLNVLSRIPGLKVAARTSAFAFKGQNLSVAEIGEALNVETVLEGSVRQSGDRVRVTAQLINVSDGFHVWSESYDRELTDIFAIQEEIARAIVGALEVTLGGESELGLAAASTSDVDAYNDYLRGRHFWNRRTLAAFDSAILYFSRAVLLDPEYARAYAGLAQTFVLLPEYGGSTIPDILPYARAATERALSLDPESAEAYVASAYWKALFERDWNGAEHDYLRAIELDPDHATAHQWYAELLAISRRWDEAVAEASQAYALDPLAPAPNFMYGIALGYSGRSDEALARFNAGVEYGPDVVNAHYLLAFHHVRNGDYGRAAAAFDRTAELRGSDPEVYRAYLAALSDSTRVQTAVDALTSSPVFGTIGAAEYLANLNRVDEALAALEIAYEAGNPYLPWANAMPEFDAMRSDPRMVAFLAKLGL